MVNLRLNVEGEIVELHDPERDRTIEIGYDVEPI